MTQVKKIGLAAGGLLAALLVTAGIGYVIQPQEPLDPGWTLVSTADTGDRWYVNDASTTYEDGRYAQTWVMNNQAKADKDGTRSYKVDVIFDCASRQYRFMSFTGANGQNGHGKVVSTDGAGPTRNMPPGTNIANVADYVCQPLYQRPASDSHSHATSEDPKQI